MGHHQPIINQVIAIILAAGKGTRIKATRKQNKVTYTLDTRPMITHTVEHLSQAGIKEFLVVVGFAKESVMQTLGNKVNYVEQRKRLGTGHAVKTALKYLNQAGSTILVMYGDDSAFYPPELFEQLITYHQQEGAGVTVMTLEVDDPQGLGRIIRKKGQIIGIVEEKNANQVEKRIREINTGLYCFDREVLRKCIKKIKKDPVSGEYYLTEVVAIALSQGIKVTAVKWPDNRVWWGVNTPDQLKLAREKMRRVKSV